MTASQASAPATSGRVTADDFFSGLFAGLALRGFHMISIRGERFDRGLQRAFEKLRQQAEGAGLNVRFRIRTHKLHRDSLVVRDSITTAAQRDLISLDNPEFQDIRLKLTRADADALLGVLPGGEALFANLVDEFLEGYEAAA